MLNKRKNTLTAVVLLIFISFLAIGSYGVMYVMKYRIKASMHAMIKTLPDSMLVQIEQSYKPGAEDKDEIVIRGEFYDVSHYRIEGDTIIYYCYYDKADTHLACLSSHWHELNNIQHKRNQLAHLFKIADIKYVSLFSQLNVYLQPVTIYFSTKTIPNSLVLAEVCTPPPQLL